jgi:hypothetical protein
MSRESGFSVADIATNMARDEKFRRLARLHPDLIAVAFAGYVGITLESWAVGRRVKAIDGWPEIVPWSEPAIKALRSQNLLDTRLKIPMKTWTSWYGAAFARRDRYRQSGSLGGQKKASNASRGASNATATLPEISSVHSSVALAGRSSRPYVKDSPKPPQAGASVKTSRKARTSPRANGTSPRQLRGEDPAVDAKALASLEERTAAWNATHPSDPLPMPSPDADWFERPKA